MKDFPTQREYIQLKKDVSCLDVDTLKKQYKKAYYREYNRRRIGGKKLTIRLTKKQYKKIQELKKNYPKYSLNMLMVESIVAYQEKKYLPHNPEEIRKLKVSIDKIGNNINQVVHKMHLSSLRQNSDVGTIKTDKSNLIRILNGFKIMKDQLEALRNELEEYLSKPNQKMLNLDWEEVRYDKMKIKKLIKHLADYLDSL